MVCIVRFKGLGLPCKYTKRALSGKGFGLVFRGFSCGGPGLGAGLGFLGFLDLLDFLDFLDFLEIPARTAISWPAPSCAPPAPPKRKQEEPLVLGLLLLASAGRFLLLAAVVVLSLMALASHADSSAATTVACGFGRGRSGGLRLWRLGFCCLVFLHRCG